MEAVRAAVAAHVAAYDASHDITHIERVARNAERLAAEEGVADAASLTALQLAALCHDLDDAKYSRDADREDHPVARRVLAAAGYSGEVAQRVCALIAGVSYTAEVARLASAAAAVGAGAESGAAAAVIHADGAAAAAAAAAATAGAAAAPTSDAPAPWPVGSEAHLGAILQDADRLDAIGAVGVARCLTFGAARGRPMHVPGVQDNSTTVGHFYAKLLKLRGMMKTAAGRRSAEQRHSVMAQWLAAFEAEWLGQA